MEDCGDNTGLEYGQTTRIFVQVHSIVTCSSGNILVGNTYNIDLVTIQKQMLYQIGSTIKQEMMSLEL